MRLASAGRTPWPLIMTSPAQTEPRRPLLERVGDFWAYLLPMGIFLIFVQIGAWSKGLYPITYVLREFMTTAALILFWPLYTRIRWKFWWLGIIVGVIGIVQWVGMQLFLQQFSFFKPPKDVFDPTFVFHNPAIYWGFIAVRMAGAVLVVPVMEELFWRDFLWRSIIAPNNFKLAEVGEWDWKAFLVVAGMFATVHGNWWLTAIVWGLMIGALLLWTKSLGACILAHATTNLLLALYVLYTHDWSFW
jgi:hypothetical protein